MRVSVPINFVGGSGEACAAGARRRGARLRNFLARARGRGEEAPALFVQWAFYAFVFSLPFETINVGPAEPPTILGALLVASALVQPRLFLRWPPRGFWCFAVYLYLFAAFAALEPTKYRSEAVEKVFVLAQLVLLGWIAYNLLRDGRVAERALLSLVFACALLAFLQISGIAAHRVDVGARVERVTAFGFHPNNLARVLTVGLLALVGLAYGRARAALRPYVVVPIFVVMGVALVQTGSRGALVALGVGLLMFVAGGGSVWTKVRNALAVLLVLGFLGWVAFQSDIMRARFERTMEEGDLARREVIYPSAWEIFQERPLAGWGPVSSTFELGSRLGHPEEDSKNPHNLILYTLVTTGLLGTIPLLVGIGYAARTAWRSRRGSQGVLPLALVATVLVANMSGLWLFNKLHWLVMAYALASSAYVFRVSSYELRVKGRTRDESRRGLQQPSPVFNSKLETGDSKL
jgi:O-antigen ligase